MFCRDGNWIGVGPRGGKAKVGNNDAEMQQDPARSLFQCSWSRTLDQLQSTYSLLTAPRPLDFICQPLPPDKNMCAFLFGTPLNGNHDQFVLARGGMDTTRPVMWLHSNHP